MIRDFMHCLRIIFSTQFVIISELQITVERASHQQQHQELQLSNRSIESILQYVCTSAQRRPPFYIALALQLDSQLSSNKSKFSCCSRSFYAANFNIFCRASHTNSKSRYSWTTLLLFYTGLSLFYLRLQIFFIHFMLTHIGKCEILASFYDL